MKLNVKNTGQNVITPYDKIFIQYQLPGQICYQDGEDLKQNGHDDAGE